MTAFANQSLPAQSQPKRKVNPFVYWLVPILGLLIAFSIIPIFASFFLSLFDYQMLQPLKFVGLQNFIYAFTVDRVFTITLVNTLYYALLSVPIGMAISLLVAHFIFGRKRLQSFFRTVYFLPVVTPAVAIAIVWRFIYQPSRFGFLNGILGIVNIPPQKWLTTADMVIPSIVAMAIWAGLGYNMVLFLAGLGGIPTSFYEAARVDGANEWQMFWKITIPLLSPTILFTTVTGTIGALQVFTAPYIMTNGGPENASRMVVMWVQETGFAQFRMGYASALSVVLFLIILILTIINMKFLRTRWSY